MILPLTELLIAVAVLACLLLFLLVFAVSYRKRKKSQEQLFGSTFKVAPTQPPESPVSSAVKVQPGSIRSVGSENDLENFGAPQKEQGLSSIHERWTSIDKTVGSAERSSEDQGKEVVSWKLWFKLEYFPVTEQLEVSVFKAQCFPEQHSGSQMGTQVFVRVYLLPEEAHRQTAQYPNNGCPSFNEIFNFAVAAKEFPNKRVRLSMYDIDATRTRICLGHTAVNLLDMQMLVTSKGPQFLCCELEQLNVALDQPSPEVHVSLYYHPVREKLKMQIFAARNLHETNPGMRFYLRTNVILGTRSCKTKRTEFSNSLYGIFHCSYAFQIPPKHMDTCCLKLSVVEVDSTSGGGERAYATLVIGPCLYAHGSGVEHWKEMLNNMRKPVEMWHRLTMLPAGEPATGTMIQMEDPTSSLSLNIPEQDFGDSSTDVEN